MVNLLFSQLKLFKVYPSISNSWFYCVTKEWNKFIEKAKQLLNSDI